MNLSKLENRSYEELKKNGLKVFRIKDLCLVMGINKVKAYNLLKALKKKEVIKKIGNGFFSFKDANELLIATSIHYPSYISFWSALNYYGFSDQTPKRIFIATTKYSKELGDFKYITLSKKRFFGYIKSGDVVIAEKEKAIIDSLLFPKYAGGISEIVKAINSARKEIDINKLISYALKIESNAILRRLGYILESLKYKEKSINQLKKKIGNGYELLDPSLKKKNKLNDKWLLDVNIR